MAESMELQTFRKNFYNKYQSYLIPVLNKFEEERKSTLKKAIISTIVLCLIGVFILYLCLKYKLDKHVGGMGGLILYLGISAYYFSKKSFEHKIKSLVMDEVCKCFGNIRWESSYKGNHELFHEAGVVPSYNSVIDDDVFLGTYKDVNILLAESEYIKKSGSNKYSVTVFKGVVIKLDMNKLFSSHTIVYSDALLHFPIAGLKKTELEDVAFEKKYDVFTNDPVDARYILTPAFMEKIKNIEVAFSCKNIKCAFYRNNLIISMSTDTDLFAVGSLVRPVVDPKQFTDLLNQFISILALIDLLKLNEEAVL